MNKKLLFLPLLLLFSACFKKKQVNVSAPISQKSSSEWQKKSGTVKFDDDVDEFFLEDDAEGNVFEEGAAAKNVDLDLASLPLEDQNTEVIQFDFDKTNIKPEEKAKVARNSKHAKDVLKDNSDAVLVVDGHSCKIAKSQTYNYMISQERAENVAKEYVNQGVPAEKVKAVGHGSSELITNADGKEAQSVNRRAETKFAKV